MLILQLLCRFFHKTISKYTLKRIYNTHICLRLNAIGVLRLVMSLVTTIFVKKMSLALWNTPIACLGIGR